MTTSYQIKGESVEGTNLQKLLDLQVIIRTDKKLKDASNVRQAQPKPKKKKSLDLVASQHPDKKRKDSSDVQLAQPKSKKNPQLKWQGIVSGEKSSGNVCNYPDS